MEPLPCLYLVNWYRRTVLHYFLRYCIFYKWLPVILIAAILCASFLRNGYASWVPPYVLLDCRMDAISFGILVAWVNYYYDLKALAKKHFKWLVAVMITDVLVCGFLYLKYNDLGPVRNSLFALVFHCCLFLHSLIMTVYMENFSGTGCWSVSEQFLIRCTCFIILSLVFLTILPAIREEWAFITIPALSLRYWLL